jgi:arginase family enzyme
MTTTAVVFPFDLFGHPGAGAGADLLGDALLEILADNRRERVPTRADSYTPHVRVRRLSFERMSQCRDWRERGRRAFRRARRAGEFLLWLAGNHLGVLPVYDELAAHAPDTLVVQLDAHLDVQHFSACTAELSHGNFLLHCAGPLPPILNLGHRDLLLPPEHVARSYRGTIPAATLAVDPDGALKRLRKAADAAPQVFLDLDCDVLDPVYFPAVADPVPFGLSPTLLLRILDAALSDRVVGVAVSEFHAGRDRDDRALALLVWLLEHVLLKRYETG